MLANHGLLIESLQHEINISQRDHGLLAVLLINVNSVTNIDGILGYQAGDLLRRQIERRLQDVLRASDILGSISRDEFGCILPLASEGHAILAAHKIMRTLEAAFMLADRQMFLNLSVGISCYPDHSSDADTLMKHANVAMHEARRRRAGSVIYSPEHNQLSQLQFELHAGLGYAIENSELFLHYQPQMDLHTGRIDGAEALLRWDRGDIGYTSPINIIEVAENTGLISALTAWVFNTSLRERAGFQDAGLDISISVNFSTRNLLEPELPDLVSQALRTWNVPPGKILIEITESAMMEDEKRCLATLMRLKELGVKLSIDDFGTGYASISYLRKLPVDEVKIDVSIVQNMLKVKEDEQIVRAIIALGHNFDLEVVAEGVEDNETLARLIELGCDKAQGNHISASVPANELEAVVLRYNAAELY